MGPALAARRASIATRDSENRQSFSTPVWQASSLRRGARGQHVSALRQAGRQPGERPPEVPGIVHGVRRNYFDERIATGYDAKWANLFEPAVVDPAVSFVANLAGTGAALELGIGTGRLALPLSQRGVRVHGIELSPAMLAQLQAKPGADALGVTLGDFATTPVGGTFRVAYLVFNTIMNLTAELDLMARLAGMTLRERWSDWDR